MVVMSVPHFESGARMCRRPAHGQDGAGRYRNTQPADALSGATRVIALLTCNSLLIQSLPNLCNMQDWSVCLTVAPICIHTLHCIALRCVALHCIAWHGMAWHGIAYIHTYIHTHIHMIDIYACLLPRLSICEP